MAINGATSRCQRACHQCLLNTLASYLFRSPPNVVHHRGCPLASLHRGCCNLGCPRAPKPYVHPSAQRKAQGSHSRSVHSNGLREAPQHTARRSLQHASICYEVRRWPTITVRATVPCREGLRPGAALLHLWYRRLCSGSKCNMRLDMAVFAWGHMMHEQDASAHLVPSCNAGKGG